MLSRSKKEKSGSGRRGMVSIFKYIETVSEKGFKLVRRILGDDGV